MSTRLSLGGSIAVCLLLMSAAVSGLAPSDSIVIPSIETFMQIGSADRAQITEDGGVIFFETSLSGVDQVYRLLPSGWPYQMTVLKDGIDFYRISPSGDKVVVGASVGGSEQSDLYLLDAGSGTMSVLKRGEDVRHGSPLWSPDEEYLYFSSNEENGKDFFIYRMHLENRAVEKIWGKGGWNSTADISADGRKLLLQHYESNVNSDLYLLDLDSGQEVLLTEHDDDYIFDFGLLTPDARYVYFMTNMNDDGLVRVARKAIDVDGIEFINSSSPWETEEMDMSPDSRLLAWVENVEGYGELHVVDLASRKSTELSQLRGIVSRLDISSDGTIVFTFSSPAMPPDIWKYNVESGDLEQLTYSTFAGIDRSLFVEPELIKYESFDGLQIPAFLYLPPGWDGKPIPFVIHAHGGPESQFRPSFVRHFQYLVLNGYGVIAPNIRGSSGYGRDYIRLDDYKKRKDSVRDIYQAARWLIDNGYARFGKIGIKGASYGGYMTLAALVEYPEIFGAGIDHIGIANFVTFLKNTKPYRRAIREAEYGPLSDEEFLTEISPMTHADRIEAPLLIVHGENDTRVPVGEARQIAEAIRSRGGVVETLIFPDEGHGVAKLSNRLIYYRRMVDFLDKHLKD